jgi:hypothetical protein
VKESTSCIPGQVSLLQPRLEVEALVALPKPDARKSGKQPDDSHLEVTLDPR